MILVSIILMSKEIPIHCKYDELVDPSTLKPYKRNRNQHPQSQIDRLARLYEHHGIRHPIIVDIDRKVIAAGHGRRLSAIRCGVKLFPVVYQKFETEEDLYAFVQADNASTMESELDFASIHTDLPDLGPFDLDALGIPDFKLEPDPIDNLCDEDEIPEAVKSKSKLGDLFILGEHRLLCGDSTLETDVAKLMNGLNANIMMTDPPYGVKLDQSWRDKALGSKAMGKGNIQKILNDDNADWLDTYRLFKGNVCYVWHADSFADVVMNNLREAGFDVKQQIIWNKSVMVMGRSDYHYKHEPCWYAIRKGKTHDWIGDRKQTTILDAKSPNHIMSGSKEYKTDHPSQKPVDCMMLIQNNSGDVYDPFGGSGSTLIACEKTNRKCFMMELDPNYCAVIIERWQKFTSKQAHKLNDDNTSILYDDILAIS